MRTDLIILPTAFGDLSKSSAQSYKALTEEEIGALDEKVQDLRTAAGISSLPADDARRKAFTKKKFKEWVRTMEDLGTSDDLLESWVGVIFLSPLRLL